MPDQLLNIILEFFKIVSSGAFLTNVQFQHLPQSSVNEVFTSFQLTHPHRSLPPLSLANNVHDRSLALFLHCALGHLLQHLVHTRQNSVLIREVQPLMKGRHFQPVFVE
jgi:hypothetical protein